MAERFISVDIEASGPVPGEFSLLTIGACLIEDDRTTFQAALKPLNRNAIAEAMRVSGLSLDVLDQTGLEPREAMAAFRDWLRRETDGASPVFVGLNAAFDWGFVNYYFHRFLGENPFGFAALDLKALYMGLTGCAWSQTTSDDMTKRLHPKRVGTHDALEDALFQAELFRLTLASLRKQRAVG